MIIKETLQKLETTETIVIILNNEVLFSGSSVELLVIPDYYDLINENILNKYEDNDAIVIEIKR